jgi:hypothetical protein
MEFRAFALSPPIGVQNNSRRRIGAGRDELTRCQRVSFSLT